MAAFTLLIEQREVDGVDVVAVTLSTGWALEPNPSLIRNAAGLAAGGLLAQDGYLAPTSRDENGEGELIYQPPPPRRGR